MRLPNVLTPLLFFVEGWLAGFLVLRYIPATTSSAALYALVPGIAFGVLMCTVVKRKLIAAHRTREQLVPTTPDRHNGLDLARLDSLTSQLLALGFVQLVDYTIERAPSSGIDGFARLFAEETAGVIAEVNQVMRAGMPATIMALTLFSFFENDWSFTTITRPPSKNIAILYALRRPRRLWQIIPGAAPGVAFERHTAAVARLRSNAALTPVSGDPVDAYLQNQQRQKAERLAVAQRRGLFAFLWDIDRYSSAPTLEWMGDAERQVKVGGLAVK